MVCSCIGVCLCVESAYRPLCLPACKYFNSHRHNLLKTHFTKIFFSISTLAHTKWATRFLITSTLHQHHSIHNSAVQLRAQYYSQFLFVNSLLDITNCFAKLQTCSDRTIEGGTEKQNPASTPRMATEGFPSNACNRAFVTPKLK